jgi:hypothetical protein
VRIAGWPSIARGLKFNETAEDKKQLDLDIVPAAYGAESEVVGAAILRFVPP